uniref:Uncharacterized protein n=1 Tax=viral metagenome TaxID=1070528 RepID=A0A6C0BP06_9ZZZZ
MNWGLLVLLLLAVGTGLYIWRRNVRSVRQFGDAIKADVRRLSPRRTSVAAPGPSGPSVPLGTTVPGAYAHGHRRHHHRGSMGASAYGRRHHRHHM